MAKTRGKIMRAKTSILLARDLNFCESQNDGLNRSNRLRFWRLFKLEFMEFSRAAAKLTSFCIGSKPWFSMMRVWGCWFKFGGSWFPLLLRFRTKCTLLGGLRWSAVAAAAAAPETKVHVQSTIILRISQIASVFDLYEFRGVKYRACAA